MEKARQKHRSVTIDPYLQPISWKRIPFTFWVMVVTLVRILAALYIFIDPLWGFILTLVFDFVDWQILKRIGFTAGMYQVIDKPLDWVGYVVEVIVGWMYGYGMIFLAVFAFRLAGQYLYSKTNRRIWFIVFPNMIEIAFIWWILLPLSGISPVELATHTDWLFLLILVKMLQECFIHLVVPRYYVWRIRNHTLTYHLPLEKKNGSMKK